MRDKTKFMTVWWDWEDGEAHVQFEPGFRNADWVTQLDAVVDAKYLMRWWMQNTKSTKPTN